MKKVTFGGHPEFVQRAQKNMAEQIFTVDVTARGERFHAETLTPSGTMGTSGELSDIDLEMKFRRNAQRILTQYQIDKAVESIVNIEDVNAVSKMMDVLCI
jgi:hypothetical protein